MFTETRIEILYYLACTTDIHLYFYFTCSGVIASLGSQFKKDIISQNFYPEIIPVVHVMFCFSQLMMFLRSLYPI